MFTVAVTTPVMVRFSDDYDYNSGNNNNNNVDGKNNSNYIINYYYSKHNNSDTDIMSSMTILIFKILS